MARHDRLSTEPLYLKIRKLLAKRSACGIWRPDAMLADEQDRRRTPVEILDKSPLRLRLRRQGRGTSVAGRGFKEPWARLGKTEKGMEAPIVGGVLLLAQARGEATTVEWKQLQLSCGEMVLRTTRLRREQGRAFMYETAILALGRFPGLADADVGNYAIVEIARQSGVRLMRARERISVVQALPEVARRLGVVPRSALLKLDRVILAAGGEPVEWRVSLCPLRDGDKI
jgi:DNA-binding GntR family transcriptional regulator